MGWKVGHCALGIKICGPKHVVQNISTTHSPSCSHWSPPPLLLTAHAPQLLHGLTWHGQPGEGLGAGAEPYLLETSQPGTGPPSPPRVSHQRGGVGDGQARLWPDGQRKLLLTHEYTANFLKIIFASNCIGMDVWMSSLFHCCSVQYIRHQQLLFLYTVICA